MPITEYQREQRRKHVGGSDLAAILGVDPFKTAEDVRLEKTGRYDGPDETPVMLLGTMLESSVLDLAELQLGKMRRNQYRAVEGLPIGVNTDAIIDDDGTPVEAKTSGITHFASDEWGDDGTDQVPDRVIIQCHGAMLATKKNMCHVPALLGGRGFVMFAVPLNKDIADIIAEKVQDFWDNHVIKDVPCDDILPSMAVIKKLKRVPEKIIDLDIEIFNQWQAAKEESNIAKKAHDEITKELLAKFGDAEGARVEGVGLLTYLECDRKGYTVKPTKYRTLRLKKT